MSTVIKNVNVVTVKGVISNGCVCIENGLITYVGNEYQKGDIVIDGEGKYLLPGFIDIHCHGCLGQSFQNGSPKNYKVISDHHLKHGTTTLVATTVTAPMDNLVEALENYSIHKKEFPNTPVIGVHMEGPWLSPKQCGAQPTGTMRTPNPKDIEQLKEKYPFILRVGAAPELDQNYSFSTKCAELGIVCSVAHTDATFKEIESAIAGGYNLMTHLYSGMKGMYRENAYRIAGAIEAGLYFDELYAEIIADGKHLPPELLKFIYKCKGADKLCLITDATSGCGYPNGTGLYAQELHTDIIIEDDVAKIPDRTSFAGSTATYDRLFKVMATAIGDNWVDLMKMTSYTPAKIMGFTDRGEISVGKKADLVIIDKNYNLNKIFYKGELI